jgi:hypothetical protein
MVASEPFITEQIEEVRSVIVNVYFLQSEPILGDSSLLERSRVCAEGSKDNCFILDSKVK